MPYKYIFVDTKHEFQNSTNARDRRLSTYKVRCNAHPLRMAKRVAVVGATIPNTFANVDEAQGSNRLTIHLASADSNTPTTIAREATISIEIPDNYYDANTLLDAVNPLIATAVNREGDFQTLQIELRIVAGTTFTNTRFFIRAKETDTTNVTTIYYIGLAQQHNGGRTDQVLLPELGFEASTLNDLTIDTSPVYLAAGTLSSKWKQINEFGATPRTEVDIVARAIPTIFNQQLYFINSPELTQSHNVLVSHQSGDELKPENHLMVLHNSVNRGQYLHYEANQLLFHELHSNTINQFSLELRNHNNKPFSIAGADAFNVTLIFEYDEQSQIIEQQTRAYADQGWSKAHRVN